MIKHTIIIAYLLALTDALAPTTTTAPKALNTNSDAVLNRRNAVFGTVSTIATFTGLVGNVPSAVASDSKVGFVGTFSDPINHPGGKREIKVLEGQENNLGDYKLAQVIGGGGIGEPKNYVLPAVMIGDRTIVIDFSPKGGPKDFVGVLENGDIRFLKDNNRWPRLKE